MERYRKTIYCDWDFLESYISMVGEETPDIDMPLCENIKVAECVRELLFSSDVKLFINASREKFDEELKDIEKKRKNAAKKGRDVILTPFEKLLHQIDLNQQNILLHVHFNSSDIDFENLSQKKEFLKKERSIQETMIELKQRFGKNAVLKGMNFEDGATTISRNGQIGGHKA